MKEKKRSKQCNSDVLISLIRNIASFATGKYFEGHATQHNPCIFKEKIKNVNDEPLAGLG